MVRVLQALVFIATGNYSNLYVKVNVLSFAEMYLEARIYNKPMFHIAVYHLCQCNFSKISLIAKNMLP